MAQVTVGFKGEDHNQREFRVMLPEACFLAEILDVKLDKWKGGKDFLEIPFRIIDAPAAPEADPYTRFIGQRTVDKVTMPAVQSDDETDKETSNREVSERIFGQMWKTIQPEATGSDIDTDDWIGVKVVIHLIHEDYQVTRVNEFSDERVAVLDEQGKEVWRKSVKVYSLYPAADWEETIKPAEEGRIETETAASAKAKTDPLPDAAAAATPAPEAAPVDEDLGDAAAADMDDVEI